MVRARIGEFPDLAASRHPLCLRTRFVPPIDVWNLIDRDHRELERALDLFVETPTPDLLDEVRLGLAAHVEAEGKALVLLFSHRLPPHITALFAELSASHRAQERH